MSHLLYPLNHRHEQEHTPASSCIQPGSQLRPSLQVSHNVCTVLVHYNPQTRNKETLCNGPSAFIKRELGLPAGEHIAIWTDDKRAHSFCIPSEQSVENVSRKTCFLHSMQSVALMTSQLRTFLGFPSLRLKKPTAPLSYYLINCFDLD